MRDRCKTDNLAHLILRGSGFALAPQDEEALSLLLILRGSGFALAPQDEEALSLLLMPQGGPEAGLEG